MRARSVYPFLIAAFPALSLWATNPGEARATDIAAALLATTALAFGTTLIARRFVPSRERAAALGSLWALLLLSYGHIAGLTASLHAGPVDLSRAPSVTAIAAVIGVAGTLALRTRRAIDAMLTRTLTIVATALVVMPTLEIAASRRTIAAAEHFMRAAGTDTPHSSIVGADGSPLPDLYYIVLDGYASYDTLRDVYGLDNSAFYAFLQGAGFTIAGESRSNYPMTLLSLASSLNMEYLDADALAAQSDAVNHSRLVQLIHDSRVARMLRERGYRVVHFSSGWDATETNPYADVNVPCGHLSDFAATMIRSTFIRPLDRYLTAYVHPRRITCEIDELARARDPKRPSFVFAHLVAPHPPFVFGRNGEWLPDPGVTDSAVNAWGDRARYVDELLALNTKLRVAIEAILRDATRPVVIVLQGDHGPASLDEWRRPGDRFLHERLTILDAYLVPPRLRHAIYPSITPVNSFRMLLDAFGGADLPTLADRSYFSTYDHPFALADVTNRFAPTTSAYHSVSDRPAR
jgi:hypothetical protein